MSKEVKSSVKKKSTLKNAIATPVSVMVILGVTIMGVVCCLMGYNSTVDGLKTSMSATGELAQKYISSEIEKVNGFLSVLAENSTLYDGTLPAEKRDTALTTQAKEYGALSAFFVSASGKDESSGKDYSGTDYFQASMNGQSYVTSPYVDSDSGELSLMFSSPVYANGVKNSSIIGVLCMTFPQSILNDTIAGVKISDGATAYIIDKDGYTIADPDTQLINDKENIEDAAKTDTAMQSLAALHAKVRAGESGFGSYKYKGVSKFLLYAPIDGTNGWSVCINSPKSNYLSGVKLSIIVAIVLFVVFLFMSFLVSSIITKKLVGPVRLIVDRMTKFSDGDITSPLPEFNATSIEFDELKGSIQKTLQNTEAVVLDIDYLLGELAQNNLRLLSKVPDQYVGDFARILERLRILKANLNNDFRNITMVAEQVSAGASQVSSGAQSLAQGATEQASSIQELSASISEVSQQVKDNAEGAEKAKALTQETGAIMEDSISDMNLARQAMDEISSTSKNISKVIKAIDDIAFQTNILALNAAVEAARAGSAGKGFAVVADEVRNLSQKSAEAAKNTTSLIESSITAVEKGTDIVNRTSASFTEVAAKSSEVEEIIGEIAEQAQAQATAISQISIGIDQVSSVVQMNSATSEESAAASEELSSQAVSLKNLVDQFNLADMG